MKVKFKKLRPTAVVPSYAKSGDCGLDLTAADAYWDVNSRCMVYGTGLAVEIPEGFVGLIFPRSSIVKTPQALSNSVGVIDSGYRGEIKFMFRDLDDGHSVSKFYKVGDRVGQLVIMPFPTIEPEESEELSESERGTGGFGSSGK